MSILPSNLGHHTFQAFDVELDKLDGQLLKLIELLLIQLELSIQSLEKSNPQYTTDAIGLKPEILDVLVDIDAKVLAIIARYSPVANDLRTVVSYSKIADQLEQIGREITDFGCVVNVALSSPDQSVSPALKADGIEIGRYVLDLLHTLKIAIDTCDTDRLFILLEADRDYETGLYNKLEDGLVRSIQNKIEDDVAKLMNMMKLLEFCPGEFRRIFALVVLNRLADCDFRHKWIAEAAYYLAEHRNFVSGFDIDDWLKAEQAFQEKILLRFEAIAHEYGGRTTEEINAFHLHLDAAKSLASAIPL